MLSRIVLSIPSPNGAKSIAPLGHLGMIDAMFVVAAYDDDCYDSEDDACQLVLAQGSILQSESTTICDSHRRT